MVFLIFLVICGFSMMFEVIFFAFGVMFHDLLTFYGLSRLDGLLFGVCTVFMSTLHFFSCL